MSTITTDVTLDLTAGEARLFSSAIQFESTERCPEDLATEGVTESSREDWHRALALIPPLLVLADQVMPSVEAGEGASVTAPRAALRELLDKVIGEYDPVEWPESHAGLVALRERVEQA